MATLQSHNIFSSSSKPSTRHHLTIRANLHRPSHLRPQQVPFPSDLSAHTMEELELTLHSNHQPLPSTTTTTTKLFILAEAAADRAEMHAIIGAQRNNWAHLLLFSINSITLTASTMAGISAIPSAPTLPLKISSAILFAAATGMMLVTNKIQPNQLAEEQRNAARLFRQLEKSIHTSLALQSPTSDDDRSVEEAMERVLALDKAYPLPLLPGMLEKFPSVVEPAVWWPKLNRRQLNDTTGKNGWSKELEDEMKGVVRVLKKMDTANYLSFARLVLTINRVLGFLGPLLTGLATAGTSLIGFPVAGPWPVLVAVIGGAVAAVVNGFQHGAQVGMVFELSRNCAGHYRRLEEVVEHNLKEREVGMRENGELFEMKVALQLGRSLDEMKNFSSYASPVCKDDDILDFAGKLF